jgi:hypothetical protein
LIEFGHDRGRDDHASVQARSTSTCSIRIRLRRGLHQRRQSLGLSFTIVLCRQFLLSLLPESGTGRALALEILDGVLQRNPVMLKVLTRRQRMTWLASGARLIQNPGASRSSSANVPCSEADHDRSVCLTLVGAHEH